MTCGPTNFVSGSACRNTSVHSSPSRLNTCIRLTSIGIDGSDPGLFAISSPKIGSGSIQADGAPGAEIHPATAPLEGDVIIKKHRYSAFYGTDLEIVLRGLGVDAVVIAGVTTENCCHATARDAFFATTAWCFCPTRRTWARVACLDMRSTTQLWSYCLTPRPTLCLQTNSSSGQQFHK